jgi:hypothetical protein
MDNMGMGITPRQIIVARCFECAEDGSAIIARSAEHDADHKPRRAGHMGALQRAVARHNAETGHTEINFAGELQNAMDISLFGDQESVPSSSETLPE